MAKYYAESGINWIFVYEVTHEDDDIIILKDLGRYHKYDEGQRFEGKIDAWFDFCGSAYLRVGNGPLKLFELA